MAINLSKPQVGSNISVTPLVDDIIYFDFPTSNVELSQVGDNFVLTFDDGSTITLLEFYNVYNAENMPTFNVEGVVIDGETFFTALEATELMPAAGPTPQQNADGAFFNAGAVGDLNGSDADPLSGVDTQQDSRSIQFSDNTDDGGDFVTQASLPIPETIPPTLVDPAPTPANPVDITYSTEQSQISVNVALILDSSGSLSVANVQNIENALVALKNQLFDPNNPNALALDANVSLNLGVFDYDYGVRVISVSLNDFENLNFADLWDEAANNEYHSNPSNPPFYGNGDHGGLGATNWDGGFDIASAWFNSLGAKDDSSTDLTINHSIFLTDGGSTTSFGDTFMVPGVGEIDVTGGELKYNAVDGFYYKEIISGTTVYQVRYPNTETAGYGLELPTVFAQENGEWVELGKVEQIDSGNFESQASLEQAKSSVENLIESMGTNSNMSLIFFGSVNPAFSNPLIETVKAYPSVTLTTEILGASEVSSGGISQAFQEIFNKIASDVEGLKGPDGIPTVSLEDGLSITASTIIAEAAGQDYDALDEFSKATELAIQNFNSSSSLSYSGQVVDLDSAPDSSSVVDDVFIGGRGNETVYSGAGNDVLFGGGGQDKLYGEAGDDTLHGGTGSDVLYGGQGADALMGGDGNDTMFFDSEDTLFGGNGLDIAVGTEADILAQLGNATGVELFVNDLGTATESLGEMNSDILMNLGITHDAVSGTFTLESGEWQIDGAEDANGFTKYVHADYEIWINTGGVGTNVNMRSFSFSAHDPDSSFYADTNITDIQADSFIVELKSVNTQSGIDQDTADAIEDAMSGLDYIDMTSSVFLANNGLSYDASQNALELSDSWESQANQWHNMDTGLVLDDVETEINVVIQGGA